MVLTADQFPAFANIAVDQIFLYKWESGQWVEIPAQVDEIALDNLKDNMSTSQCQYDHDPCEWAYVLSGTEGNGFDSDPGNEDELVFMARDTGSAWANSSTWVGNPQTDTLDTRYRIAVNDSKSGEVGYVYAYAWRSTHAHNSNLADYVTTAAPGTGDTCNQAGDQACGWLRSTDEGSIGNLPRFNMFFAGDWSMEALCIKPYATDSSCTVGNNNTNIIDLSKFRTTNPNETEHGWDLACRNTWPVKDGPVRLIRRIQGAQSGKYTTKVEKFYGTWFEQVMNLRVHPIGSVSDSFDHRVLDEQNPSGETPSLTFTQNSWALNSASMDTMDLVNPASLQTNFGDWIQVDTSRGTYVKFSEEPRPIQDATKTFIYEDNAPVTTTKDNQAGVKFGQSGFDNDGTGPGGCIGVTEDLVCDATDPEKPSLNFARSIKVMIPLAVDTPSSGSGVYESDEAVQYEEYRTDTPLITGVLAQGYTQPDPPGPGPCAPTLGGSSSPDAWHIGLNVSGCSGYAGFMLYRGLTPGSYDVLADLKGKTSFEDMKIQPGLTYRYAARAYDVDGNLSNWSSELVITTTDTTPPPSVQDLVATPGSNMVRLDWTDPNSKDIHEVKAKMATSSGGPYFSATPGGITCGGTELAITNLDSNMPYYFVVVTVDSSGNETESLEVSATPF